MDIPTVIEEFPRVLLVVFIRASKVFARLLRVSKDAVEHTSEQPQLISILLGDGLNDVV